MRRERGIFNKYGPPVRTVLEAILEKYLEEGAVGGLDNIKLLEVAPFNQMGIFFQLIQLFGTKAGYEKAVHDMQTAQYL